MAWVNPSLFSSGQTAGVSANLNVIVADLLVAGSPTTTYTPTWAGTVTNPTISNGTVTGYYWQIGKLVIGSWRIVLGTTTNIGAGNYTISLPIATAARYGAEDTLGTGLYRHQATPIRYSLAMYWNSSTTIAPLYLNSSANPTSLSASAPVAPASTDVITGQFMYESV